MLADSLAGDPFVQIVRVDATKNDIIHPNVRINAFPTFYFFSVGDQGEPIEYDGERTLEAILKFIKAFKSSAATKAAVAAAVAATATATGAATGAGAEAGRTGTADTGAGAEVPAHSKQFLTQEDRSSSQSESGGDRSIGGETAVTGWDAAE